MTIYSEYEAYSPIHDEVMTRVSVADDNGREFWTLVPTYGKGYRDRRSTAIDMCLEAIQAGCSPGEVRCS